MPIGIVPALETVSSNLDKIGFDWLPYPNDPNLLFMITEKRGELMIHFKDEHGRYRRGFIFKSDYEVDYAKEGLNL